MNGTVITLQGEPIPQGRPRAAAWRTGTGQIKARAYTDPRAARWRESAAWDVRRQWEGPPLDGPLAVEIDLYFRCPPSDCRAKAPRPRRRHAKRPDVDNVVKNLLDLLNGLAWRDDGQVCELMARKWIAAQGEQPRIVIRVRSIADDAA